MSCLNIMNNFCKIQLQSMQFHKMYSNNNNNNSNSINYITETKINKKEQGQKIEL